MTADPDDLRNSDLFPDIKVEKWTKKVKQNNRDKKRKVSFDDVDEKDNKFQHRLLNHEAENSDNLLIL